MSIPGGILVSYARRARVGHRAGCRQGRRPLGGPRWRTAARSVFNYCNSCFSASPALGSLTYLDPASANPRIVEIEGRTGRRVAAVTVPRLEAQGTVPDSRLVATYVESAGLFAQLIDPKSGRVSALPAGPSNVGCIATTPSFTPDSHLMAIGDGCVHVAVWDLRNGRLQRTVRLPEPHRRLTPAVAGRRMNRELRQLWS